MVLSSLGETIAQAAILIFPPFILASAALKIRLARLDLFFSHRTYPAHFWIDTFCVLAFAAASLGLVLLSDRPLLDVNLMMGAMILGQTAGNLPQLFQPAPQPSKLESAPARQRNKRQVGSILLWCLAVAVAVLAYIELLT